MKNTARSTWNPQRLDARAFALAGASLQAEEPLSAFERLQAEVTPAGSAAAVQVRWRAQAEMRSGAPGAAPAVWLHLQADVLVPLTCQRCMGPVNTKLVVDRWFRFVADEAAAEAEDDDCEEDLLALEPRPDLREVLEDELLMELPLVPMHGTCPVEVPMRAGEIEAGSDDLPPTRPNPFAGLADLKKRGNRP